MPLTEIETRVTAAVDSVAPAVAIVRTRRPGRRRGTPFGIPAEGSGVVLDRTGLLVTNQHVVDEATEIQVELPEGWVGPARVVGGDPGTDIALVRIDHAPARAATLGDSEALHVGQFVLAVGNALGLPGNPTVSIGVVSALERPLPGADFVFEGLIQTDAAINPGNSGGPLLTLDGAVVGINTAVMPFAQGVGFALPIHAVQRIAEELRVRGRVVRPWIGVSVAELRPSVAEPRGLPAGSGLLVVEVVRHSPAHRSGLKAGDVLHRVGPFPVRTTRQLLESLARFPVGTDIAVGFRRRGNELASSVPLEERPTGAMAEAAPPP